VHYSNAIIVVIDKVQIAGRVPHRGKNEVERRRDCQPPIAREPAHASACNRADETRRYIDATDAVSICLHDEHVAGIVRHDGVRGVQRGGTCKASVTT
jgi:hypothetical protein